MTAHEHVDGSGEGYCSCGAERCSLPGCDMGCVHPGGWAEREELLELRRPSAAKYLSRASGCGDCDPNGSGTCVHGCREAARQPRAPKTGRVVCRDCGDEVTLCLSGHVKHANGDRSHLPRSVAEQVAW